MRRVTAERPTQPTRARTLRPVRPRREIKRFELLVDELSAVMTRTPAHAVDDEIETWLGKISQALGLDRSGVYERDSPTDHVRTTHTWRRPEITSLPRDFDPEKFLKTTTGWVLAGNQVVFSSPGGIPAELADARSASATLTGGVTARELQSGSSFDLLLPTRVFAMGTIPPPKSSLLRDVDGDYHSFTL